MAPTEFQEITFDTGELSCKHQFQFISVYFCTMDGFFRILEKTSWERDCKLIFLFLFANPKLPTPTSYMFLKKQYYCLAFYVRYFCVQFIAHLPICDVFFHIQNEANVIMAQNIEMEKIKLKFLFLTFPACF